MSFFSCEAIEDIITGTDKVVPSYKVKSLNDGTVLTSSVEGKSHITISRSMGLKRYERYHWSGQRHLGSVVVISDGRIYYKPESRYEDTVWDEEIQPRLGIKMTKFEEKALQTIMSNN